MNYIRYRLMIMYWSFICDLPENDQRNNRYVVFSPGNDSESMKIHRTFDSKYELLIWLDMNNLELGKPLFDRKRMTHFNQFAGKVFNLLRKKV